MDTLEAQMRWLRSHSQLDLNRVGDEDHVTTALFWQPPSDLPFDVQLSEDYVFSADSKV